MRFRRFFRRTSLSAAFFSDYPVHGPWHLVPEQRVRLGFLATVLTCNSKVGGHAWAGPLHPALSFTWDLQFLVR